MRRRLPPLPAAASPTVTILQRLEAPVARPVDSKTRHPGGNDQRAVARGGDVDAPVDPPAGGALPVDATPPRPHPGDWAWIAALLCLVALAWCAGTGRWTAAAWATPTAYLDGYYADVISTFATMRAAADGHLPPLAWKTVPELGAPFDGNWNDWPSIEELPYLFLGLLGRLFGPYAGLNLGLLIGHLLAAATFFVVARAFDCSRPWAFVGGLAYGLAPFIFAQSPHHITVAWAWHVPLFLLVWRWAATDDGLEFGTPRFAWAVGIAVLTGLQNVYYTNVFCQLTLLGAAAVALRRRSFAPLRPALAVVAAAAAAFALMNVDTWTFRAVNGANAGAVVREYKWLEIYGLKLVDLVMPPVSHRSGLLAGLAAAHRAAAPLQDEGSYLGLVGLAAVALLVGTAVLAAVRGRADEIPMEAWLVLWIVLCFSTGGFNAIVGAAGFTLFRTGCRYSVVILAVALLYAARRLTARDRASAAAGRDATASLAMAALLGLVVFFDQVPRAPAAEQTATIARQVESDRAFVARMESALPPGAMVFQLPIMPFPEAPAPGVPSYDHFRPYVQGGGLRYSFGSTKGRPREQWQLDLGRVPLDKAVAEIEARGFAAIYINRNGFPDKGQQIVAKLREMGYTQPAIESDLGDLVCIPLAKG